MTMKRLALIFLAMMLLLSGCGKKEEIILPEITERTIVLPDIGLQVENVFPYTGIYIEQGDDENKDRVEGVCALAFTNTAEKTIYDASLTFTDGIQTLDFYFQMLPYGNTVTVVEFDKKVLQSSELQLVDSRINYLQDGLENRSGMELITSEYGSVTLKNASGKKIPKVEVYYRRAYENGTLGGICYKGVLKDLGPGDLVFPEMDYWSEGSTIVNILVYSEEAALEEDVEIEQAGL